MSFQDRYNRLNQKQKEAVNHIDGPCIVLAGPGTGKTETISIRIANLLKKTQVSPHNILCLTFTDSGAVAMRKRLISIIGEEAYYVRIHTFHSFCNFVILENPDYFGLEADLTPVDDLDKFLILKSIFDSLNTNSPIKPFGNNYHYLRDAENLISRLKQEDISPDHYREIIDSQEKFFSKNKILFEDFISIHGRKIDEDLVQNFYTKIQSQKNPFVDQVRSLYKKLDIQKADKKSLVKFKNEIKKLYEKENQNIPRNKDFCLVYANYQKSLKEEARYDFNDMILFVVKKLQENDKLLAKYQEIFQYILVDEFQDSSGSQNEILYLLGSYFEDPNIFVVGDDDQSIYRFQGASLENIIEFSEKYKKSKLISLKENYRSNQEILDASESIIKNNTERITCFLNTEKNLKAQKSDKKSKIKISELSSSSVENFFISKKIGELIKKGVEPKEIAVLYRKNRDADEIADFLARYKIPYKIHRGENILEKEEVRKIIDLMIFISDFSRTDLLYHILHFNAFNLDPISINSFFLKFKDSKENLLENLESQNNKEFNNFLSEIKYLKKISENESLPSFFEEIIRKIYGNKVFQKNLSKKDADFLNSARSFFMFLKNYYSSNKRASLKDFLERIGIMSENGIPIFNEELWTNQNSVNLMTAHKSKGLEFEYVFIPKADFNNWGKKGYSGKISPPFGIIKTLLSQDEKFLEDERRLFYVAITRAKRQVFISWPNKTDSGRETLPCIFVNEIKENQKEILNTDVYEEKINENLSLVFKEKDDSLDIDLDILKPRVEKLVLSVTDLNTFLKCPRLFYYSKILRLPYVPNKFLSFGNAVHKALAVLLRKAKEGNSSSKILLDSFFQALKKEPLTNKDLEELKFYGRDVLENYFENYKEDFSSNSIAEYNFRSHGVNLDGIPITGIIDRIDFLDKSSVHIVEYKTGNPDGKSKDLKSGGDYHRQLAFYKILTQRSPRFPYEMKSGEINFIVPSRSTGKLVKKDLDIKIEDIDKVKDEIKDMWEKVNNFDFSLSEDHKKCEECKYREFCF